MTERAEPFRSSANSPDGVREVARGTSTEGPDRGRLILAITFALLAWASSFLIIRAVAPHLDPGSLSLARLAIATLVLGGVLAAKRIWVRPTAREWLLLAAFGIAWFFIYNLALNAAEHELDPGTAAMLVNVAPLIVALVAGSLLGEGFPKWLIIGTIVAFCGVGLIGVATSTGQLSVIGVILALVAALTYATGILTQKPLLGRISGLQITFVGTAIGTIACLPWTGSLIDQASRAPLAANLGALSLGVFSTALAFVAWAYALKRMSAGSLSSLTFLVPVIATIAAWPLLGEIPPPLALVGGLICLGGVALTRIPKRKSVEPDSPPA